STDRGNYGHPTANEIFGQRRQPIVLVFRPAIFDGDVAALDKASFAQALAKRCKLRCISLCRCRSKEPDHWHRRRLRARPKRPSGCRAAKRDKKFSPSDAGCHVTLP